ncbi:hypothetical protein PIB30_045817 [Stylosanthes scabra]|uniref:Uncharacterized protein n=1 Tax=Stylosanthes scabra TaxID=79078 RepID=A0ABU6SHT4_9FABA|nr:hypothetical protein [Stylosanthes scabra]
MTSEVFDVCYDQGAMAICMTWLSLCPKSVKLGNSDAASKHVRLIRQRFGYLFTGNSDPNNRWVSRIPQANIIKWLECEDFKEKEFKKEGTVVNDECINIGTDKSNPEQ